MRTRETFIERYALSHMNTANQIIHLICVPAIFMASIALAWLVPVGRFMPGIPADWAIWINLGTLAAVPMAVFYARLGASSLLTGLLWLAVSYAACIAIQAAGASLLWIGLAVWVAAWAVQIYGHKLEGAKPSFADDLVFLLIGPLFVQDKLVRLFTTGSIHPVAH